MLVSIYAIKKNIMKFTSVFHFNKAQEVRKNKSRVAKTQIVVEQTHEQQIRNKIQHYNKVIFQHVETPNEDDVEIGANEVSSPAQKKNKQEK